MIYIKFFDIVLIIIVASYIGISKAKIFSLRVSKLRELKSSFNMFKSKLEFTYEPIKSIFEEISKIVYSDKNNIFKSYIENMKAGEFEKAWNLAVAENSYSLTAEDIKIISSFGNNLGKTDMSGQISEIDLLDNFLDKQLLDAEDSRKKNDKLYKSLGVIIGITIVIIFI